jgi:uncharacterized membrane protein
MVTGGGAVAHRDHRQVPVRARRVLAAVSAVIGVVTLVGVVVIWPRGDVVSRLLTDVTGTQETYDAEVISVIEKACLGVPSEADVECKAVTFRVLGGPDEGERASIEFTGGAALDSVEEGSTIVVARNPKAPREVRYSFVDHERRPVLFALAVVFAVAVVLLGRLRGITALIGLVATFLLISEFLLPAILSGRSPTVAAAFGASAIAYVALYLAHGFGPMTTIALLGTLSSLFLTVALGTIFVGLAEFSGLASEEAFLVNLGAGNVDLSGLVLAGVIIGALGAIDDMTVTQASAVSELVATNPGTSRTGLFRTGLRIGRDHVSSTVNTLFLAYVGASLPLLLLFVLTDQSALFVANRELVATEIARTLIGSIGLVASVPLTTWLAAYCYTLGPASQPRPVVGSDDESDAPTIDRRKHTKEPEASDELWIPERRLDVFRRRRR